MCFFCNYAKLLEIEKIYINVSWIYRGSMLKIIRDIGDRAIGVDISLEVYSLGK